MGIASETKQHNVNMAQQRLYTEEQVKKAIAIGYDWCHVKYIPSDDMVDSFIESLNPIKLPSDQEIEEGLFHQSNEYAYGYKDAFKWMREQILNK